MGASHAVLVATDHDGQGEAGARCQRRGALFPRYLAKSYLGQGTKAVQLYMVPRNSGFRKMGARRE